MKNIGKRTLCFLFAVVMLLSYVAMPNWNAQAEEPEWRGHTLFEYDYTDFSGSKGKAADDADAHNGKAMVYTGLNLSKDTVPFTRYESSNKDAAFKFMTLGEIAKADLKVDQGYQNYAFEVAIPATGMGGAGNYVYLVGPSGVLNVQMAADLYSLAGKSVTITLSMKIEGDLGSAQVSVDRMLITDTCLDNISDDGTYCTACGKNFITDDEDASVHDLFVYNYKYFTGEEVKDPDAMIGKAMRFTGQNLAGGAKIKIYRYDPGHTDDEFSLKYQLLGSLEPNMIWVDGEYHTYRFETTLPVDTMTDSSPYVYFTDNWAIRNVQMAKDLKTLAGKNIAILLSIKVTGSVENATIHVEGARIVESCKDYASEDGKTCTKCGEDVVKKQEVPVIKMPEGGYVYKADDFLLASAKSTGDCVEEDTTSKYGKAAVLSHAVRLSNGAGVKDLIRTGNEKQKLYIYGPKANTFTLLKELTVDDLKANAEGGVYVEYTATDIDLIPTTYTDYYMYFLDSWGFQLRLPTEHQVAIHNQTLVDVTISLKITGDVTGGGEAPTYYIDMISIKPAASGKVLCRHTYSSWTEEGRKHASVCDKCGVAFSEFHKWDDGVIVKDYTETEKGEKLFTCTVCGATKTETFDAKLRYVFRAENFHVPSTTGVDKIIEDPTAPNGMVAAYSYADRLLAGQKNAADLYRINNQRLKLYSYGGGTKKQSYLIGELDVYNLNRNSRGGEYVTYKFKNIEICPDAGTYYLYMFDGWGFQVPLSQAQVDSMVGKRMDVFLTLKVTGLVNSRSSNPSYFIDEIVIQETSKEGDDLIVYIAQSAAEKTTLPVEYKAIDFRLPLASYGSGDAVVDDPTSAYGRAVLLTYEKREAYGNGKHMIRTPGQVIRLYTDTAILVGEWTSADLQANSDGGEYVVYEFKNLNLTGSKFMYMFDCWGFQIPMEKLTGALQGVNVDVKVSMKVTGNVSDPSTNPSYYIDYISVTETPPVPEHDHVFENWTTDVLNHKSTCTICFMRQEGFHMWDDGTVLKEAVGGEDGEICYTCKICGYEDVKKLRAKPGAGNEPEVDPPVDEPESMNLGLIIGVAAAGLVTLIIIVVVIIIVAKKGKKKN